LVCLLGRNGLVHRLTGWPTDIYGFWGLLIANTLYSLPQAVIVISTALERTPARHYDAAASLGAGAFRQFLDVTLPRLRFALVAAAFLVFTETLTDFGSAVVVGGNYRVLAMEIYSEVVGQMDFGMGATLGVLLLLPALLSVALGRMARRRQDAGEGVAGQPLIPARRPVRDVLLGTGSAIALLPMLAVVATVAYVSLVRLWPYDPTLTIAHYLDMPEGYGPVATSLGVSLAAAVGGIALVFAFAAGLRSVPPRWARPLQFLATLPAAVPGMVLGLGYVLAFNHGPLSTWLYGSVAIVAACSFYHYHAQAFLTMQAGMRQVPGALEDVVSSLGGRTRHVLRDAILPFAAPATIAGFFYLFMRSMVTLSGVIFLVTPDLGLASVSVMRLDENGFLAQAAAYAMIDAMWHEERHTRIRDLLRASGKVSVERIVTELGVSRETIRRDLVELAERGEIRRVHGGAVLADDEPPIDVRHATRVREKRAIARKVSSLVESGQTVFMDAGSTMTLVAEALSARSGLTIVTNSVDVATRFAARPDNEVRLLGGRFDARIGCTHGSATIAEIARYQAHLAILSPVGIDAAAGASSFELEEAEIARAMCANARSIMIAADHAKIGVRSRVAWCPADRIDVLVTDRRSEKSRAIAAIGEIVSTIEYA
ncbi:hypothetical protein KCV01_g5880, partial [Aureobasidium melanogenum]